MRSKSFRFPVSTLVGSRLSNTINMFGNHRIASKYYGKIALTFFVAAIFELLSLWEKVAWRKKISRVEMKKPPVFIVGFWRSGTTLLHNLMCCDPDAAYTSTFHNVFPNLVLSQKWWLSPITNLFLPEKRPFDNVHMDMNNPQEEEFGMVNLQPYSLYNFWLFPEDFDSIVSCEMVPETFTDEELERWKQAYTGMIRKAMLNTKGTRFISKNPCNIARISLLKEMFPGAKFIFIHREPTRVVESFYNFIFSIFPGVQLQRIPEHFNRETVVKFYAQIMNRYFSVRKSIDPSDLVEISMDELLRDPVGVMNSIYSKLGIDNPEELRNKREQFLLEQEQRDRHTYEIPQETIDLVEKHASHIMVELGYIKKEAAKEYV